MTKVGPEYLASRSKRGFDVVGAAAVGLALLPAAAAAYTAAAIDNRSLQPFFSHDRVGADGQKFTLTKLRTLRPELVTDEIGRGTYDPRATGIGRLLRRYGLDEVPQLRTVLEGEMSLIGIRAYSEANLRYLQERAPRIFDEWYEAYEAGRPALVSAAQVFRRKFPSGSADNIDQYLQIDIDYVKQACLRRDLKILGSTPLKLLEAHICTVHVDATETALSAPVA